MVGLAVEANDERLEARLVDPREVNRRDGQGVSHASCSVGPTAIATHLSACKTSIPVIILVGMFPVSMSTTRIREVTEMRPPAM